MKKVVWKLLALSLLAFNLNAEKLNVLLVLTDDQGYGELSCNGNPYLNTPNIDRFSLESYRFTNYHSSTTCAPTRAGLMTGMYASKVGVWHTIMGRSIMDSKQETIAEVFKKNGYATGLFGKWHLGDNYPYRPCDRGFDSTLWFKGGAIGQSPDFWGNNSFNSTYFNNISPEKTEGYSTDVFTERAIEFMKAQQAESKAFFCYLALNAPHSPFNVRTKYTQKFLANSRVPNANYYAVIEKIDDNFARIESFLKESGLAENTIVIFSTDNGSAYGARTDKRTNTVVGYNAGMRDKKGSVYEGGHRVPFFMRVPKMQNGEISQLAGYIDLAPTLYDICGIRTDKDLDGISLKSVLENANSKIERYLIVDTQRQEAMSKDRPSVVMYDNLRLVNRAELYDLDDDMGQLNDIAKDNQELVDALLAVHDEYWDYVKEQVDIIQAIYLTAPNEEKVILSSHDRHLSCFWDQSIQIRANRKTSPEGFWYVKVPEDGLYSFELLRWAMESDLNLKDSAPAVSAVEGTSVEARGVGYAFSDIVGAELMIGDINLTSNLSKEENPKSIKFENVELKKGEYKLYANFLLPNEKMGVHYLKVTR